MHVMDSKTTVCIGYLIKVQVHFQLIVFQETAMFTIHFSIHL